MPSKKWRKKLWWMIPISLLVFLALTVLIPYIRFKLTSTSPAERNVPPVTIAHRGASGTCPENTMASFKKALELGAPMIELDVHVSKDGDLIVMHDPTVDRTTNGKGKIRDLSTARIRALDAGSWYDTTYSHERVPLLAEVFDLLKGKTKVLVELKWDADGHVYEDLVDKVLGLVRQYQGESWVIVQSFHPGYLEELDQKAGNIPFHQLVFGVPTLLPMYYDSGFEWGRFKAMTNASSVNIQYLYASPAFIEEQHKAGRTVYVFTLNEPVDIARAWNMGVDGIITNYPDRLLDLSR